MSTGSAYDDNYVREFNRLCGERDKAAGMYAAQMLYLREETAGRRITCTPANVRKRVAEEAAQEWLRITGEIEALNAAAYAQKRAAEIGS